VPKECMTHDRLEAEICRQIDEFKKTAPQVFKWLDWMFCNSPVIRLQEIKRIANSFLLRSYYDGMERTAEKKRQKPASVFSGAMPEDGSIPAIEDIYDEED